MRVEISAEASKERCHWDYQMKNIGWASRGFFGESTRFADLESGEGRVGNQNFL